MPECKLVIKDEVNCKFEGLDATTRKFLTQKYKYKIPYAHNLPAVKLGRWDGCVGFFQLGGATFVNLLPEILTDLYDRGWDITLTDLRTNHDFVFNAIDGNTFADKQWPDGHPCAGQPIVLRDYQMAVINEFLANPQSLQVVATGAGKCLTGDTMITVDIDPNTEFGAFAGGGIQTLPIGKLANIIEEYTKQQLVDNREVDVSDFGIEVSTPTGPAPVNHFIKKCELPVSEVTLSNGYRFKAAQSHILVSNGVDVKLSDLGAGDYIDHRDGQMMIDSLVTAGIENCYDIAIPSPHHYYDANGLVHHNTLITAALSHMVEQYGRSIVIVPNKSLVTQTEDDYRNMGLDVGVFYGDRKEFGHTHTICTWQSLSILFKNTKNHTALIPIHEFLKDVICVIVDEVHGAKGAELAKVLTGPMADVPLRWGLTGTIPKEKFEFESIRCSIGDVVNQISAKNLQDKGVLSSCNVNIIQSVEHGDYVTYHKENDFLVSDPKRLDWMAEEIKKIALTGNTLVLLNRIVTGKELLDRIPDSVFVSGETKNSSRREEYKAIETADNTVLIATFGVASTGISITKLHNVVLIEPGKSFVRTIQSIGRGLRKGFDKDHVEIWDICGSTKYSKKHLTERKSYYKDAQYPFTVKKVQR